jgi:general secretion pathway protein D
MDRRTAFALLASCAWLAGGPRAEAREIAVYGLELDVDADRERLLVFADAPIEPTLIPVDEHTLMIGLPGAVLDPTAPTDITPKVQGTVSRVTAFDRAEGGPEVRIVVQRRPGAPPRVERRASMVAFDFEPIPRAPARAGEIRIGYKNTPIATVITDLAKATGESIVFDDQVAGLGNVTIEGPPQATRAEALALIDSLLLLRGFAAVPSPGGARKVLPINGAPSQWRPSGNIPDSDVPVTTLLRLETADAADLVPVITPYLGANATAAAFPPTNSLILSGPSSLLRTLRTAIQALDQIDAGRALVWPMRYASAETVADQLLEIAGERDVPYASSDERLNALLLRVRPGEVEHVRQLVDRLDRPTRGAARVQVLRLRYADPVELAEQLSALRDGGSGAADPAAKRAGLRGLAFQVAANEPTHSLVVSGAPETIDAVFDVVSEIDRVPASVRVEITVASVDLDDRLDIGTDYLIPTLSNPKSPSDLIATVTSNPSGGGIQTLPSTDRPFVAAFTRAPLIVTIVDPISGAALPITIPRESASLTMNGATVTGNLLMRPTLLITSGKEHEIFSGDNVPIPVAAPEGTGTGGTGLGTDTGTSGEGTGGTGTDGTGTGGTSGGTDTTSGTGSETASGVGNAALEDGTTGTGTTGTTSDTTSGGVHTGLSDIRQNIERKDVGTTLRVTPTVGERGGVRLELYVEVSAVTESVAGPVEEVGPSLRKTTIESTIRLEGGEVAVIATAPQPMKSHKVTGVPWLMDIPVLGWAFRLTNEQTLNHHLLIAARAEILRPESRDLADRFARALRDERSAQARP